MCKFKLEVGDRSSSIPTGIKEFSSKNQGCALKNSWKVIRAQGKKSWGVLYLSHDKGIGWERIKSIYGY